MPRINYDSKALRDDNSGRLKIFSRSKHAKLIWNLWIFNAIDDEFFGGAKRGAYGVTGRRFYFNRQHGQVGSLTIEKHHFEKPQHRQLNVYLNSESQIEKREIKFGAFIIIFRDLRCSGQSMSTAMSARTRETRIICMKYDWIRKKFMMMKWLCGLLMGQICEWVQMSGTRECSEIAEESQRLRCLRTNP